MKADTNPASVAAGPGGETQEATGASPHEERRQVVIDIVATAILDLLLAQQAHAREAHDTATY